MPPQKELYKIQQQGPFIRIYQKKKLIKKRIVSAKFIKLWYLLLENRFDSELYDELEENDKLFFIELYTCYQKNEGEQKSSFESFRVKLAQPFIGKLKMLEGSIMAGNMSKELLNDYEDVLDKLKKHNYMTNRQATTLFKRLKLTYDILEESDKIISQINS